MVRSLNVLLFVFLRVWGQNDPSSEACLCVEYWNCASKNGTPYSYCGISDSEVCCFFDKETTTPLPSVSVGRRTTSRGSFISRSTPTTTTTTRTTISPNEPLNPCGVPAIQGNMDSISQFKEWPWHVAILEVADDLYLCGGTLIGDKYVITAAHCLNGYTKNNPRLKVRLGEYDVSSNNEANPHVEALVSMVAIHPDFNNSTLTNDIALLGLSRKIDYQENILPVCLPPQGRRKSFGRCVVTGWGRTSENSEHSIILKEVIVPLWPSDQCERRLRRYFGPTYRLSTNSICAGDEGKDACDGDGGGPLVCFDKDRWVLEGIVSFGVGCGRAASPGIYTRVSSFVNWVNRLVEP